MKSILLLRTIAEEGELVYRPTARVLAVLELLQARGRMTGAELARRLEVDARTVRRYVETLQDLGIPVEAEMGRHGGYRLRPGYRLPPLIFSEDEAVALTLALLGARARGLARAEPALEGALAKVERTLPGATRERVAAVGQTVVFAGEDPGVSPPTATVATLAAAVDAGHRVRLRYRSAGGEVTARAFDPHGVVDYEGRWYLIGHCHLRRGERLLRLDRIERVEVLGEVFPRPAGFDALAAVRRALATVPSVWQVAVWVGAPMATARRELRLSSAYFADADGGTLLRGEVDDLGWLARRLAGLGFPFDVQHPAELRAAVRRHALAIAALVDGGGAIRDRHQGQASATTGDSGDAAIGDGRQSGSLVRDHRS